MRKIFFAFLLVCPFLIFALNEEEYQNFRQTIDASHERSYFAPGCFGNVGELIFEGRVADQYFINFQRNANWAADAEINITMRMLSKKSVPIYTPSYNPGINFYYFDDDDGIYGGNIIYALGFYHFSNGQAGDYYIDNDPQKGINYKNGNFSTNYITIKSFSLKRDAKRDYIKNIFGAKFSYYVMTFHTQRAAFPKARLDLSIENVISDWYKVWNLFGRSKKKDKNGEEIYTLNRIKVDFGFLFGYMKGHEDWDDKITFETTYSYKPSWLDDFSFFTRYYYGSDYYNIHFNQKISEITMGIMSDNFNFRGDYD